MAGLRFLGAGVLLMMVPNMDAQTLWENPVKKLLREGKPVIGATITIPSADLAAQAASIGFDFLWIEMEHSPITLETARNMIMVTRGLKAVPFTRVPVNELWTAKRVLDIGSLGVMFPFTSTPELARQAVAACKYPPAGRRGWSGGLATLRWPAPEGYADFADRNVMVVIIVEQARAVDQVDEIAAIPGIDAMFIGTSDLSFSLGCRGRIDDPKVTDAIQKVLAAGKRHKVPVGLPAREPEAIKKAVEQGFQFIQGPSDLAIYASGARPLLDALGKTGFDPKTRPMY